MDMYGKSKDCVNSAPQIKDKILSDCRARAILFKKTAYSDGMINLLINFFGGESVDFIDGPYWAKMFVLCIYTVWIVMPFKILILTGALASVKDDYYKAAKIDSTPKWRVFTRITLPMISPMIYYLVITGFIGSERSMANSGSVCS